MRWVCIYLCVYIWVNTHVIVNIWVRIRLYIPVCMSIYVVRVLPRRCILCAEYICIFMCVHMCKYTCDCKHMSKFKNIHIISYEYICDARAPEALHLVRWKYIYIYVCAQKIKYAYECKKMSKYKNIHTSSYVLSTYIYICACTYGVATISRLLKIIGFFCRISSLL